MTTHTPTHAAGLVTCAACTFRAVLTSDGRALITEVGDTSVDHLAAVRAQQAERRAYVATVLARLDGQDAERHLADRLRRYIKAEHGL